MLEPFCGHFWAMLGLSWGRLGQCWLLFGSPLGVWWRTGRKTVTQDRWKARVFSFLELSCNILAILERVRGHLERSRAHLGAILGDPGPIWGPSWAYLGLLLGPCCAISALSGRLLGPCFAISELRSTLNPLPACFRFSYRFPSGSFQLAFGLFSFRFQFPLSS